jgi:hypothetical protein
MVRVPATPEMTAETFRKHLEARHIPQGDFADLKAFNPEGTGFQRDRGTFETYHDHLHRTCDYEHEHRA